MEFILLIILAPTINYFFRVLIYEPRIAEYQMLKNEAENKKHCSCCLCTGKKQKDLVNIEAENLPTHLTHAKWENTGEGHKLVDYRE